MIEPTDEMVKAFERHFFTCFRDQDVRDALAAVLAIVERDYERPLREAVIELHGVLVDLVDPDPCQYDHHGYCQAHGWLQTEPRCPHARAKDVLS